MSPVLHLGMRVNELAKTELQVLSQLAWKQIHFLLPGGQVTREGNADASEIGTCPGSAWVQIRTLCACWGSKGTLHCSNARALSEEEMHG